MTDLLKTKNRTSQFYELHGMTLEQWRILYRIFDRFRDTLSWVKLFSSRARGDYKTTSDVDLAIASKADILTPLQTALEDSQLPYTFDLIDYFCQSNNKLKSFIDQEGILIWNTNQKGRQLMMSMRYSRLASSSWERIPIKEPISLKYRR